MDRKALELPAADFGRPRAPAGKWASLIRVIDPVAVSWPENRHFRLPRGTGPRADTQNESLMALDLDEDEAAFSMSICYFERMGGEPTLVVGTAVQTTLIPRACKEGWLRVYAIRDQGRVLEFMHKVSPAHDYLGRCRHS